MIVECVTTGPFETNAYLVGCEKTKLACVIDPAPDSHRKLLPLIKKHDLHLKAVYLTHSHIDHIADAYLYQEEGIPIYVHILDAENLEHPGSDGLPNVLGVIGVKYDGLLEEGDIVSLGELSFQVLLTPGHSPGGLSFYFEKEKILFTGDALFRGTYGRVDFPTSSARDLYRSLSRLVMLPEETRIFSGHGEETTVGQEKAWVHRLLIKK